MECLNAYSGLFSLLAVIAAVVVPIAIYYKQKKDQKQDLRDEYDAMNEASEFPMISSEREHNARKNSLEKKLRRK